MSFKPIDDGGIRVSGTNVPGAVGIVAGEPRVRIEDLPKPSEDAEKTGELIEGMVEKAIGGDAGKLVGTVAGNVTKVLVDRATEAMKHSSPKLRAPASDEDLPEFQDIAVTGSGSKVKGMVAPAREAVANFAGGIPRKLGQKNFEVTVGSGDKLDPRQFSVHERLSSLFQVNLVVMSDNPGIEFDDVVGQPAKFSMSAGQHDKFWSGVCNHFEQIRAEPDGLSTYQFSIVPTMWFLTQRKNYRMFQQISEPDIALKILSEWGIEPQVRIDKGAYKKRKYRVQYNESDFSFVSRMLEDAGITYYFEQNGDETKLVLADAPQSNERRAGSLTFLDDTSLKNDIHTEFVTGVRMGQRVRPGKYTMRDHDYRKPSTYKLLSTAAKGLAIEEKLERFQYVPGAFLFGADSGDATPSADDKGKARTDEKEAAVLAQKRLDAKRGGARTATFETNAYDLAPGVVMGIRGHAHGALGDGKTFLVVESSLSGTTSGEWSQHCEVRGTDIPFRPELKSPRPKTQGVESATVVGPPGEEIHCDEFGRVRCHFHWDRESQMDDNSSCWIHVSQPWGGTGYGGSALPRIGQEVLVDFLGGDPDRPVIVGRVYTNLQKTPYKLPDNKTQTGLKSNSTGGGGGFNEVMFEDAVGKELLNMQAEKDLKKLVKNDESVTIGRNRTKLVKSNDSLTVGASRTKRIAHNETASIGMNQKVSVGINRSTQVGSIDSTIVGDTHSVMVSPPGEGGSITEGSTSVVVKDKKITLDTGAGASITMEGGAITLAATTINLEAKVLIGLSSRDVTQIEGVKSLNLGTTGPLGLRSAGNMDIRGSIVHINGPGLFAARVTDTAPDKITRGSATVHIGGPFGYTAPPSLAELLEDPAVTAALNAAWNESNPNAPEVPSDQPGSSKQEQGGWLVWNKDTGRVEVQRVPGGTRAGLDLVTRPADNANQQPIGWFHTHPNTTNEGYVSEPSPKDEGLTRNGAKVPGIIMTHDGIQTIPYP